MAEDTRLSDIKALLDQINSDDVAEDAAFQATIDSMSVALASMTAERDTLQATIDIEVLSLQNDRATLQAAIESLDSRITALGG